MEPAVRAELEKVLKVWVVLVMKVLQTPVEDRCWSGSWRTSAAPERFRLLLHICPEL